MTSSPKVVFLGAVTPAKVDFGYHTSMLRLVGAPRSYDLIVKESPGGPMIVRRRNELFGEALRSLATHYLSVDSDIVFEPHQVEALLEHDLPIVGGHYRGIDVRDSKTPFPVANIRRKDGTLDHASYKTLGGKKGLKQVEAVGLGFTLIKREVLEALAPIQDFYPCREDIEPETGQALGEDVFFCLEAKKKGFQVWLDLDVKVGHLKVQML